MPNKSAVDDVRVFNLADAISEARSEHPPFQIELGEGDPITVQPVQLWPDDVLELVTREQPIAAMRMLLGDDYERFTAAGGTAILLLKMFEQAGGAKVGELLAS